MPRELPGDDHIYSFDTDAAVADSSACKKNNALGYLLEAEALWWKIWCTSAEFKYGMTDARHRRKLAADQHYLDLAAKASSIAMAQLKDRESAEMQFYAGMGDAFAARLYGLRGENRATARAGVRAREHFLRAIKLDPNLTDAEFGLGLYNYYVDTLSAIAKFLGFFMGIPSGNKQEGIRMLEHDGPHRLADAHHDVNACRPLRSAWRALAAVPWVAAIHQSSQLARGDHAKVGPQGAGPRLLPSGAAAFRMPVCLGSRT